VREVHIILKKQDNRIQGFTGCNNLMGSYELREGNLISFKGLASTKMACPDMSIENQLNEVLGRVDNYSILGDNLSLNKARMAPLARFEAVYH
jgi:heat shock protein HslJ